jgi:hypothetical protein
MVKGEGTLRSLFAVRWSGIGPTLTTWALQQVGSFLRCTVVPTTSSHEQPVTQAPPSQLCHCTTE